VHGRLGTVEQSRHESLSVGFLSDSDYRGSPMPTRAEVTDVANAVFEQVDAIMLSGETTVGKFPLKCIEVFDRIAVRIEQSGGANYFEQAQLTTNRQKLVKSAVAMANELRAQAILVFTGAETWPAMPPGCALATRRFTPCVNGRPWPRRWR
jgi:hypothetical protein